MHLISCALFVTSMRNSKFSLMFKIGLRHEVSCDSVNFLSASHRAKTSYRSEVKL